MVSYQEYVDEDDVIIEGSDLHKALIEMGCTDFELTPVNKSDFPDDWEENTDKSKNVTESENDDTFQISESIDSLDISRDNTSIHSLEHLKIILTLEPLLDDHFLIIKDMITASPSTKKSEIIKCLLMLVPGSVMAMSLFNKHLRLSGIIALTSLASYTAYKKYTNLKSQKQLKTLISIQNDVFNLHKKTLKILKNDYKIKLDRERVQKKFVQLEVYRLKHLQPMCEYLLRSIENCCNLFCKGSRFLVDLLPESIDVHDMITKFEHNIFTINGEITYESLKQLYYTYILVQSDMMHVLALVYNSPSSIQKNIQLKLSQIIHHLYTQLQKDQKKLKSIVDEYQNTTLKPAPRKHYDKVGSKWHDLYVHVDLLSKQLQSAYEIVGSILEDIDERSRDEENDKLVELIKQKINDTHTKITTAKNYSEFNTLFINKFKNTSLPDNNNQYLDNEKLIDVEEDDENLINVEYDADPDIMDEVFEEYIKEEYLKPLYNNNDDDEITVERAKLDKLLEQNFMAELKGVLIDKFKVMSDREAKAILRKINNDGTSKCQTSVEVSSPPMPPPLPLVAHQIQLNENDFDDNLKRTPVPLPRTIKSSSSEIEKDIQDEENEPSQKISIHMAFQGIKFPKFTTDEETFIGSGENSEDELVENNCDDGGIPI